ncbi:MAG: phage tail protein [Blastocatellales bacterium]
MADPFVAEIRIFPFNFAPKGWAFCNGQLLPISQNTALFSLLGTTYGGDGKSTFALPNLQGSAPMQQGRGPGLSTYVLGEQGGSETVTLITTEIPVHTHSAMGSSDDDDSTIPVGNSYGQLSVAYAPAANLTSMAPQSISPVGGGAPHNNMQPYLTLNFCIALQGVYPQRP